MRRFLIEIVDEDLPVEKQSDLPGEISTALSLSLDIEEDISFSIEEQDND